MRRDVHPRLTRRGPGVAPVVASAAAWVAACGILAAGCADDGGPRLVSASPPAAARNTSITLTGTRLCGASGDCARAAGEIQLGLDPPAVRAVITSYADTTATIVIPPVAPVGRSALVATVNERASNALEFEVLP